MPIYEYECSKGHSFERVLPFSDYEKPQKCDCGRKGKRIISVPALAWAQRECRYDCPITGKVISTYEQHRNNLALHGCQEYDPGMKLDAENFRRRKQDELERSVDETVERTVEAMPSRKKELLERELSAGADVEIVRQSVPT